MTPYEIRESRHAAGLTQAQAAAEVGAKRRTWQDWEAGARSMPVSAWLVHRLHRTKTGRRELRRVGWSPATPAAIPG